MKRLAIIGKASGWRDAPTDIETWGLTQLNLRRDVSRVIDMNDYSLWGEKEARDAAASRAKAKEKGIPYVDLQTYPIEKIIAHFGTRYFSSTVDYALALAIYEDFKIIDLYGVLLLTGSEYAYQKPGADFWCGVALGRGCAVNVHGYSNIMKTQDGKMYGYGWPLERKGNERRKA
ncbi:MAG: hypothetical protein M0R74_09910 [Dehalococcoidia bacterium]|jgi:hypothetical protein|nr:hypothetical protein [Dehalococcoidia bacterium]